MQDPAGFLHYRREEADKEFVRERLRHWHEYEHVMPPDMARTQASRCMDCGTPCCHSHCPVHNLVPDWNLLVSESDWLAAYEQLEQTNNFPEFTGRICPAPCEAACTLSIRSSPVTIRSLELAITEHAWSAGRIRPRTGARPRFRRVAVVGSGPAGLACAQQLARTGYQVTVYEKADRIGGLLRYGIPDFRLEKRILDRRLEQLRAEGVRFYSGVQVGRDIQLDELRRRMHAVVLAIGAQQPRDLDVPGRGLHGVHLAMEYLDQQNRYIAGDHIISSRRIDALGKSVVVIGGGDTGGDCVGTAIRQGAREVIQVQYHDRPPRHVDNLLYWPEPAPEWHATDHDAEGCHHLWGLESAALSGRDGHVQALLLQPLHWSRMAAGNWKKWSKPGQLQRVETQLVLIATGFSHVVHAGLVIDAGVELDVRGNIAVDRSGYQTSLDGVFACGDAHRGQSLVVWAISEGRQCARAVDLALAGESDLPAL